MKSSIKIPFQKKSRLKTILKRQKSTLNFILILYRREERNIETASIEKNLKKRYNSKTITTPIVIE
jgi:hypothetical protein